MIRSTATMTAWVILSEDRVAAVYNTRKDAREFAPLYEGVARKALITLV